MAYLSNHFTENKVPAGVRRYLDRTTGLNSLSALSIFIFASCGPTQKDPSRFSPWNEERPDETQQYKKNADRALSVEACFGVDTARTNVTRQAAFIPSSSDAQTLLMPFPKGVRTTLTQGWGGLYSHSNLDSFYSLDFDVPQCTPLLSMGDGRVIDVKKDSQTGGADKVFSDHANFISIDFGGGVYGIYLHLCHGCVMVAPGDTVVRGQHIGYSGNTGWSSDPHLHVQFNSFNDLNATAILPKEMQKENAAAGGRSPIVGTKFTSENVRVDKTAGAAVFGSTSRLGKRAFSQNGVELESGLGWYHELVPRKTAVIKGAVLPEHEAARYVSGFFLDAKGQYVFGTQTAVLAGGAFSLLFQLDPRHVEGPSYRFVLAPRKDERAPISYRKSFMVHLGDDGASSR